MSTVAEQTYTPEDLLAMPDRKDYELVDGHLVERHMSQLSSWVAGRLFRLIDIFVDEHQLGWAWPADQGYVCFPDSPGKVRIPDVSFVRKRPPAGGAHVRGLHLHSSRPRGRGRLAQRPGLRGREQGRRIPGCGRRAGLGDRSRGSHGSHLPPRRLDQPGFARTASSRAKTCCPASGVAWPTIFPEKTAGKPETG